ncbi:hypothetical protein FA95DRAFT_749400 [Auriscalpium vulgare]|uniref:Uncharacterized protein n=1 Tax=Auriscalpium vulgare TaxID=40419 RepID=A0ACB8SBY5_9AGAM|nr:hypothetical protein FA95DRAFT_749400 [Auriscalpium vulgare]
MSSPVAIDMRVLYWAPAWLLCPGFQLASHPCPLHRQRRQIRPLQAQDLVPTAGLGSSQPCTKHVLSFSRSLLASRRSDSRCIWCPRGSILDVPRQWEHLL